MEEEYSDDAVIKKRQEQIKIAKQLDEPLIDVQILRSSLFYGVPFTKDDMTIWIKDKDIMTLPKSQ